MPENPVSEAQARALAEQIPELYTPYVESHLVRYRETANLIHQSEKEYHAILELGASWPWFFTRLLAQMFPSSDIELAENRDPLDPHGAGIAPETWHPIPCESKDGLEERKFRIRNFNIETEVWPYQNDSFDLIVCMELLEHLMVDPFWVFKEANRLLKDRGVFVLTTPNVASVEGIQRTVHGYAPYTYGVYSPYGGYGRHNREFAPKEIEQLARAAGFEIQVLETRNVYPQSPVSDNLRKQILQLGAQSKFLNHTIFLQAAKDASVTVSKHPDFLFHWDPEEYAAEVRIPETSLFSEPTQEISLKATVSNRGKVAISPESTWFHGAWIGLDRQHVSHFSLHPLKTTIAPGESLEIQLDVIPPSSTGVFKLFLDIEQKDRGLFSNGASPMHQPLQKIVTIRPSR